MIVLFKTQGQTWVWDDIENKNPITKQENEKWNDWNDYEFYLKLNITVCLISAQISYQMN